MLFAIPLSFVMVLPVAVLFIPVFLIVGEDSDVLAGIGAATAMLLAYVCVEWLLLVRREGQTLGKGLMRLRVVQAGTATSKQVSTRQALARLVVLLLPFALMIPAGGDEMENGWDALAYVGLACLAVSLVLAMLKARDRRTLHDLAGGTRVVKASKRGVDLRKDLRMALPLPMGITHSELKAVETRKVT